jgi:hypothetical protein
MANPYYLYGFDTNASGTRRYASDTDTQEASFESTTNSQTAIDGSIDGSKIYTAASISTLGGFLSEYRKFDGNGNQQWSVEKDGEPTEILYEPSEPAVYVSSQAASDGDPSHFAKLNESDGSTLITFESGIGPSSIALDATGVYIIYEELASGTVFLKKYAFDGTLVWDEQGSALDTGAIAANGSTVAVPTTNGNISRRDASTGVENSLTGYSRSNPPTDMAIDTDGNILITQSGSGFAASGSVTYQTADGTVQHNKSAEPPVNAVDFGESGVFYVTAFDTYQERKISDGTTNFTSTPFANEFGDPTVQDVTYAREPLGDSGPTTEQIDATKVDTTTTANTAETLFTTPITASPVSASTAVTTPSLTISQPATQTSVSTTSNDGSVSAFDVTATPADVSASVATGDVTPVALAEASQVGVQTALKSPDIEFILNRQPATQVSMSTDVLDATNTRTEVGAEKPLAQASVTEASVPSAEVDADKPQVTASMNSVDVIARLDTSGTIVDVIAVPSESDTLADLVANSDNLVTVSSDVDASTLRTFIGRGYGDVTNADKIDTQ